VSAAISTPQRHRLTKIRASSVEVTREQGGLTSHRDRERHSAPCARSLGLLAQLMRQSDHLLVRRGSIQEVLGDAEVRVEHRRGQLRVLPRPPQLTAEPIEPLTPVVGDHALEGDDVEQAV
jgi:hypothetical protein